jgi:hypothetical protein
MDQLARQSLEFTELSDLDFRLRDGRRRRQILGHRFAIDLLGQLKMRAVTGIVGFGAMATGIPTASGSAGNGTGLEVAELGHLLEHSGSVVDQSRKRIRHGPPSLKVSHTLRTRPQKKTTTNPSLLCRTLKVFP